MTAGRTTRAERIAAPLARTVVKELAAEHGACLRPVQLRRTEIDTGYVEQVLIPCGHTLASVCPSCAERARILRAAQCREGWHLDHEPVIDPDPPTAVDASEHRRTVLLRPGRPWPWQCASRVGFGTKRPVIRLAPCISPRSALVSAYPARLVCRVSSCLSACRLSLRCRIKPY